MSVLITANEILLNIRALLLKGCFDNAKVAYLSALFNKMKIDYVIIIDC